ncbi:hypothetical protein CDL12_09554 [Handroanthus impetiginosus]|uniref:EGF-like domain-containing protein n=1 Tax=Handroanthus impetiginosus TaxID=429701 RepID=A0A2G9HJS9_9LAMI|nr:hypothetical protein CDL12_09554 [Handroanthus impetiginosus]
MSAVRCAPFLAIILFLQCCSAAADFTVPFPPPFSDKVCRENICGKGKCVASNNSTFGFECNCEPGWKQARPDDDEHSKFLPCVIPNCTIHHACAKAPASAPDNHRRPNSSIFDPCFWIDCGGGFCNKTSPFTHRCECEQGYYNLFNSTAFPCYKECSIGLDCAHLGINIRNSSSPPPSPSSASNSTNHAASLIPRIEFGWLISMVTTFALVVWNYS